MTKFRLFNETTPLVPKRVKRSRERNHQLMNNMAGMIAEVASAVELLNYLMAFYERYGWGSLKHVTKEDMRLLLTLASTCKSAYEHFLKQSDRRVFKLQFYPQLSGFFSELLADRERILAKLNGKLPPLEHSVADAGQRIAELLDAGERGFMDGQYAVVFSVAVVCSFLIGAAMLFVYWNVPAVNRWAGVVDLDPTITYTSYWSLTAEGKPKFFHHSTEVKAIPDFGFSAFTAVSVGVGICALYGVYLALRAGLHLSRIPLDSLFYANELYELHQSIDPEKIHALEKNLNELKEWLLPSSNQNVRAIRAKQNGDLSLVSFYGLFRPERQAPSLVQPDSNAELQSYVINA